MKAFKVERANGMGLLYERKENGSKVVITYKYWPLFYYVLGGILILSILFGRWVAVVLIFFPIFLLMFVVDLWKPTREVKRAMKKGHVTISGSKFSFSNPLTVVISKALTESDSDRTA